MSEITPGGSKEAPIFMRLVRDDDGVKWVNVVIMLGLTILSGYLAAQSQRKGSSIDFNTQLKMRVAKAGEGLGNEITKLGIAISIASSRAYDRARPV